MTRLWLYQTEYLKTTAKSSARSYHVQYTFTHPFPLGILQQATNTLACEVDKSDRKSS